MTDKKNINILPKVGEGIYTARDISNILNLPYSKVSYWMREFWDGYTFGIKGNKAINFYTLIEFYTFYHLRELKVSAQEIKKAHAKISEDLKTLYPFARKIHTDGKKGIWYEYLENLIKADNKKQFSLKPILAPFLSKIEFNGDDIAAKYFPTEAKKVVIDPKLQFGQPTIIGTSIKAEIINGFIEGGESKEAICMLYNLHIDQVEDAILYFKRSA
ncbi:MAG: DUF433 domain-containing protein [Mucilaginibacter sp.]|uniref:DUF433 domain-containing protein n=1 Tax=Mucilaginibacter sp. TaxID=1882438 RepID=UPI0031A772C8